MQKPTLISNPEDVTSNWLTDVLRFDGQSGTVESFTAKSIGTGQVGENVRFTLSGTGDLPETLVGKFPSPDPMSREAGISTQNYRREVHFYNQIRNTVNIQTPHHLFADVDDDHNFVIMMEDLAPGDQGDQLAGCGAEQAELAMVQLAHLQGPRWGDDSVLFDDLITDQTADGGEALKAIYDMATPGFLQRYDARLTDEERNMVQQVGENLVAYVASYQGPLTLIHIDYRLDNMMFGGPYPLAVVDWQSLQFGCALNDAAYFMGTSVHEELRGQVEEQLLRRYFDTLQTYNVSLTWDDCWHYYRQYAPAGLIMAVVASMLVGETDRGNDMFMAMAKRSAKMCLELDAVDVLKG